MKIYGLSTLIFQHGARFFEREFHGDFYFVVLGVLRKKTNKNFKLESCRVTLNRKKPFQLPKEENIENMREKLYALFWH